METSEIISKVESYAKRLGCSVRPDGDGVVLVDGKGRKAAKITPDGEVERMKSGQQALIGVAGVKKLRELLAQ